MKNQEKILLIYLLLVIVLHVWGAFSPSHENWGYHFFGFFPPAFGVALLSVTLLLLIPSLQEWTVRLKEAVLQRASALPLALLVAAVSVLIMILGNVFSSKLHFLGDGVLLLRSLANTVWGENIMQSFNNQPLMYLLFRTALGLSIVDSPARTYDLYVWIDRCSAFFMCVMIFWCLRRLKLPLFSKVLLGALLFSTAGSQFFFGYIENYVLQYVATFLFVVSGWMAAERRTTIAVPVVAIVLMCGLHLGNIVFLPALLVLLLLYYPKHRRRTIVVTAILGAAGLASIYLLGYWPALSRHFDAESVDFLRPFSVPSGNFAYPMFSLYHLLDWLNLNLLVAPFAVAIAVVLLFVPPRTTDWKSPALLFLLAASALGILFTWVTNPALGLARDWDLLSGFFLPVVVLGIYFLATSALLQRSRYTAVMIATVALLHAAAWIGVNADEERHLARMRLLNDPRFLSPTTLLFYDEALANFFFDSGRYAEAKLFYEHSIGIDHDNPRIIGNLSDTYRKLGEKENYFRTLLRAVEIGSKDPGIYSNLGVEYAGRGDTNKGIEYNELAVKMDPGQQKAHANLGLLYVSKKNFPVAREHFVKAVELGMNDPIVLKYAAELSLYLTDYPSAVQYFDRYLRLNPDDKNAQMLRDRAASAAKR